MVTGKEYKRNIVLFKKMAADIQSLVDAGRLRIRNAPAEVILCPLCWGVFPIGALAEGTVVPEHIPPISMGGKVRTLTCSACNHRHGSKLEGPLAERLRYEEFGRMSLDSEAESTLLFDGASINTQIKWLGEQTFQVNFDSRKAHPDHEKVLRDLEPIRKYEKDASRVRWVCSNSLTMEIRLEQGYHDQTKKC